MDSRIQFRFELDEVDDIPPWGCSGHRTLHWFGLTSGRFWIDTPSGEVLRYTEATGAIWPDAKPFVDYQIARLFEDLHECLPATLEPVPQDVAEYVSNEAWLARANHFINEESEESAGKRVDLYFEALSFWPDRTINTSYLRQGPELFFWCVGDELRFRWCTRDNLEEGVPVFSLPNGECVVDVASFRLAAFGFCDEVLSYMRQRVERIHKKGWQRSDCSLDIAGLVREQTQREEAFARVKCTTQSTDWSRVRDRLKRVDQML
jgi:hypothetical protein